jgi:hypothetical protein
MIIVFLVGFVGNVIQLYHGILVLEILFVSILVEWENVYLVSRL